MDSLRDLVHQSLMRVLKVWSLKEAMLTVILRSSTTEAACGLVQMEAVEVVAGGVMSHQKLSCRSSDLP